MFVEIVTVLASHVSILLVITFRSLWLCYPTPRVGHGSGPSMGRIELGLDFPLT